MLDKWLQIKGDPAVRAFLFQQTRVESDFDLDIDNINRIVHKLLTEKGAFHVKIHFSSNQLTCWFADDPFRYRVFVTEEVKREHFLEQFPQRNIDHLQPLLDETHTLAILSEFKRLRTTDETVYLRNSSINRVNGMIGMTFSCDGSHYIDHKTFFNKLESFGSGDSANITNEAKDQSTHYFQKKHLVAVTSSPARC